MEPASNQCSEADQYEYVDGRLIGARTCVRPCVALQVERVVEACARKQINNFVASIMEVDAAGRASRHNQAGS